VGLKRRIVVALAVATFSPVLMAADGCQDDGRGGGVEWHRDCDADDIAEGDKDCENIVPTTKKPKPLVTKTVKPKPTK
jgi:hypothetical protein